MGVFDSMCLESGLIIDDGQALLPIIQVSKDTWAPLGLPIAGTNDRYGKMDVPTKLDANMKAFAAFGKRLAYNDKSVKATKVTLETMIDELQADGGSGATYEGKAVAFALLDLTVYDAIVKVVGKDSATAWRRFAQRALHQPELPLPFRTKSKKPTKSARVDPTTKRLAEAILADPEEKSQRKVLVDHLLEREDPLGTTLSVLPVLGKLSLDALAAIGLPATTAVYGGTLSSHKAALRDLVRFLAWGTTLAPSSGEGQILGYESPDDPDDQGGAKLFTERARQKYAGMPELLAICDRNEKAFRARGVDTGFDESDDDDDD